MRKTTKSGLLALLLVLSLLAACMSTALAAPGMPAGDRPPDMPPAMPGGQSAEPIDGYAKVYIDADSAWIVTGDSVVTELYCAGTIQDPEGNPVTIQDLNGNVLVQGVSPYAITCESYAEAARTEGAIAIRSYDEVLADFGTLDLISGMPGMPPDGEMPEGMEGMMGGGMMGPPPGGGATQPETYNAVVTYAEDTTVSGQPYESTGTDENAILIEGGNVTLDDITVNRVSANSSGGEAASFYGVGAAILARDGETTITNSTITTDANGGTGVFAIEDGVVHISDSTVTTTGQGSTGGLHAAGGGTLYASNVTVTTQGESSAAIRSDRGGGYMAIDGGSYISNGTGSPAIYCTALIAARNAELVSNNSEAICIEGLNSIYLYDCDLSGAIHDSAQNDCSWNVILYQSMSGDAQIGNSTFQMVGGTLTAANGGMFYTTNTESTFILSQVDITYAENSPFFLKCTGNSNQRGWGSAGANGAQCTFTAIDQAMEGDVIWDEISTLDLYITQGSVLTGAIVQDLYTDVGLNAWYYDAVAYVTEAGLMNGYADGSFGPDSQLTREQLATILYRIIQQQGGGFVGAWMFPLDYSDADAVSEYAYEAVCWMSMNGILTGHADGRFGPQDPVTREQLATILYRYAQLLGVDVSVGEDTNILSYDDAFDISEYAIPAIQWAVGSGLMQGTTVSTLDPAGAVTRAQAATILMRSGDLLAPAAEAEEATAEEAEPEAPEAPETPDVAIIEAGLDGVVVGTLCLPVDWQYTMEVQLKPEYMSVPIDEVSVYEEEKGIEFFLRRLGPDTYEAVGIPMPADIDEYALRSGPQSFLAEGEEYTRDELGNLCVVHEIEQDGELCVECVCLKQAENAMGFVLIYYPLDTEIENLPYLLANTSLADLPSEGDNT